MVNVVVVIMMVGLIVSIDVQYSTAVHSSGFGGHCGGRRHGVVGGGQGCCDLGGCCRGSIQSTHKKANFCQQYLFIFLLYEQIRFVPTSKQKTIFIECIPLTRPLACWIAELPTFFRPALVTLATTGLGQRQTLPFTLVEIPIRLAVDSTLARILLRTFTLTRGGIMNALPVTIVELGRSLRHTDRITLRGLRRGVQSAQVLTELGAVLHTFPLARLRGGQTLSATIMSVILALDTIVAAFYRPSVGAGPIAGLFGRQAFAATVVLLLLGFVAVAATAQGSARVARIVAGHEQRQTQAIAHVLIGALLVAHVATLEGRLLGAAVVAGQQRGLTDPVADGVLRAVLQTLVAALKGPLIVALALAGLGNRETRPLTFIAQRACWIAELAAL